MAPKQTLVQNSMLAIHVKTPTLSLRGIPSNGAVTFFNPGPSPTVEGKGTMSGFTSRRIVVPTTPTAAENAKPALLRSIRYQSTGFARASVNDTWRVDCQGSLRTAKAMPTKAPIPRIACDHSVAMPASLRVGSDDERLGRVSSDASEARSVASTQGRALPSKMPERPQAVWKYQGYSRIVLTPTEVRGCVFCRCVIITPYATPKAKSRTFRQKSGTK